MNASNRTPAASTPIPGEARARPGRSKRSEPPRTAVAPRSEPPEAAEIDFERHDTIPAPTWLDDGSETS